MSQTPKIGVILSGCGVYDGSEIHEAVITLLCLDQCGAAWQCLAPNKPFDVVDHRTKKPVAETRNVLTESARIARGEILELATVKGDEYDGLILPGGFGAARNLCTFAVDGPNCSVDSQVKRVLLEAHAAGRPIGFLCIAPALAAKVFGQTLHPDLTIGHDKSTADALEKLGARHVACDVGDFILDETNKIVTTPAYMEAKSIGQAYEGISKLVNQIVKMARANRG